MTALLSVGCVGSTKKTLNSDAAIVLKIKWMSKKTVAKHLSSLKNTKSTALCGNLFSSCLARFNRVAQSVHGAMVLLLLWQRAGGSRLY